jgi:hypothetical protein
MAGMVDEAVLAVSGFLLYGIATRKEEPKQKGSPTEGVAIGPYGAMPTRGGSQPPPSLPKVGNDPYQAIIPDAPGFVLGEFAEPYTEPPDELPDYDAITRGEFG